ncbi:MAG: metal-dependent hydrolase [Solirubrobacteraceae bacterium]
MRNATHELVGVTLAVAAGQALKAGPLETGGLAAAAVIASRLPDIDVLGARIHRRSRLERRSLLAGAAGALLRLPLVVFAALVPHRSVTHSALACAAVPGLAALTYPAGAGAALVVGGGLAIGYAGHVAADGCTPGGIRLWAPFSRRRVWLLPPRARIRTGSFGETAVAVVAATALGLLVLA